MTNEVENIRCRYCNIGNHATDIYLVARNGKFEGFCLGCYEEHLDDKRGWEKKSPASVAPPVPKDGKTGDKGVNGHD